MKFAKF